MNVVLVAQEYRSSSTHGGIGTQTHVKAHGLAALGHSIVIVAHSPDAQRYETVEGNVRVIRVPSLDSLLPIRTDAVRWLTYSVQVATELAALCATFKPDVVDFPEYGGEGYVYLLNRTQWDRVPTVVHLHGPLGMLAHTIDWPPLDSEFYRVGTDMEATTLRLADAVFSSSRCSAEWCARLYGLELDAVPVIHTGVDTTHFTPSEATPARPTAVFVGRIAKSKGADVLQEAALTLASEIDGLRIRMVGSGEPALLDEMQARANGAGHHDLFEFTGFVSRDALPVLLQDADVFAGPSRYEGGPGFVYLEAMACGLPVIACSGSGAAEVVTHDVTGLLVPPGDASALSDAMRRLLLDGSRRQAMGRRAREYAVREADSAICLRRMEAFYRAVAAHASQPATAP